LGFVCVCNCVTVRATVRDSTGSQRSIWPWMWTSLLCL